MECKKIFESRRAINFFDNKKTLDENIINEILNLANLSPSSMNLQPWEVIIVESDEKKKILRKCAMNQPKVEDASIVLIILANPDAVENHFEKIVEGKNKKQKETTKKAIYNLYGDKNSIKRKIFATKNASFFAMSVMLAAKCLGVESHPMDGFIEEEVKREFNIPEHYIIPCLIALGYRNEKYELKPRNWRRELNEFIKYI